MSLPKPGETVKITLRNGETIEGIIEWVNGNGAWVKGSQRARWVPLEAILVPTEGETKKEALPEE